jgi:hypothetical protein
MLFQCYLEIIPSNKIIGGKGPDPKGGGTSLFPRIVYTLGYT